MLVFVYGTLKAGFRNHRFLAGKKFKGNGILRGYGIYNLPHGSFPAVEKAGLENKVYGELYEIDDNDLVSLDRLEGYYGEGIEHNLYNRAEVSVSIFKEDGEEMVKAYVYLYNRQNLNKPHFIESGKWR